MDVPGVQKRHRLSSVAPVGTSHRGSSSTSAITSVQPISTSTVCKKDISLVEISPALALQDARELEDGPQYTVQPWLLVSQAWRLMSNMPHYLQKSHIEVQRFFTSRNQKPSPAEGRRVQLAITAQGYLMDPRTNRPYMNNAIRSSKYTFWSFLPRQLWYQFSKLANFYFLCVSILQMIPGLSTTGTYTTILPLMIFVSLSMGKELWEDVRRHQLDKEENLSTAYVMWEGTAPPLEPEIVTEPVSSTSKTVLWKDIRVGNVVRLQRNDPVPADLVLLYARGTTDRAYIETMALDGETNLKSRSPALLSSRFEATKQLLNNCLEVLAEDPNPDLYRFIGNIKLADETLPLNNDQILYRGSILRNTEEALGLVIYSGEECKIRMNATKNPRIKAPALQSEVNRIVVLIVLLVLMLAMSLTVAFQIWKPKERKLFYVANVSASSFPIFTSFIIMLNTMIPLSLYVSLEIIKLAQIYFMTGDMQMYDQDSNTPMEARTSTINEELGQISYIFSDKTGTLTNNVMRFRKMSVAGVMWVHDLEPQNQLNGSLQSDSIFGCGNRSQDDLGRSANPSEAYQQHDRYTTAELMRILQKNLELPVGQVIRQFLLSIALCHSCIPEETADGSIAFQATSPDEAALLEAAKEMGYLLADKRAGVLSITTSSDGNLNSEDYQILDVIEFTSQRKRMSVVVRMPNGRICVFTKGADSTLRRLLRLSLLAEEKTREVEIKVHTRKSLEAEEYVRKKNLQYAQAKGSTHTSTGATGRRKLSAIETGLVHESSIGLLGDETLELVSSPLEADDTLCRSAGIFRLQDLGSTSAQRSFSAKSFSEADLPSDDAVVLEKCFEHIDSFATDGLRTLLYGYRYLDEVEYDSWSRLQQEASTSLENRQEKIDAAASHIEENLELLGATGIEDNLQEGVPSSIDKLRRAKIKIWMLTGDKRETATNIGRSCGLIQDFSEIMILDDEADDAVSQLETCNLHLKHQTVAHSVLVIDGHTLSILEADEINYEKFVELAILVDSVVCCRASPAQKASLVRSIRYHVKGAVTLAIGDGSNDIAMIQEAHVGIGITGREGLQAARASDYSIAQFRFLVRLLLVHGRWNYVRICKYTLGTFWKETLFYFTQVLYQHYNDYTGTSLYESWSLAMFNTLFTSLPVIFMGVFEKDLKAETLLAVPELYTHGQKNKGFNLRIYLYWIWTALCESIVIFFLMLGLYGQATFTIDNGLYSMGDMTFTACIIIIATKMQYWELHNKTITGAIAICISIGGWFLWDLILSSLYKDNTIYNVKGGLQDRWGRNALWWLCLILIVVAVWSFEIVTKMVRVAWKPSDVDDFEQMQQDNAHWGKSKRIAKDHIITTDTEESAIKNDPYIGGVQSERETHEIVERCQTIDSGGDGLQRRHSEHVEDRVDRV
ncbi:hypothetical protein MMC19_001681 [Ptychographa xylographoides]|nr:hypothetical protein [Ptychographa xylographoides]